MTTKISSLRAREILDSRGNPTVEVIATAAGKTMRASVPSGASTGSHEAFELRDGNPKRYLGKGVLTACKNIEKKLFPAIADCDIFDQAVIDYRMRDLDGTEHKEKLGANSILAISLVVARLAAAVAERPLYVHLADQHGYTKPSYLPIPLFNVINGGKHADSGLDIQEFFVIPQKGYFRDKLHMGVVLYHELKALLKKQKLSVAVGDEGGFAPRLKDNEDALKMLTLASKAAGCTPGKDVCFGLDAAATEFYNAKTKSYHLVASKSTYKPITMYKLYEQWMKKYPIQIIEDGCSEDDFFGWELLTSKLGKKTILVGDDLIVTNADRLKEAINKGCANSALIKPNQIGTLTETLVTIDAAQRAGYKIVMSHRSGETSDDFISDLAVAVGAQYIKAGAPCRGERVAKYNRLLEIEEELLS